MILFITLGLTSCADPNVGTTTTTTTKLVLSNGFLGTHNDFHNGLKQMKYVINVDRYAGNGTFEANFKTYNYVRNNKDSDNDNLTFKNIDVPKTGTFAISITVDAINCFKFASGKSCDYTQGRVYYRGLTTKYNSSSAPKTMYVTPKLANQY